MGSTTGRHRLVLFDIDGTLIHTGGAGTRAMTRAFAESCRIENGFDGIPVPGRTDRIILADALTKWGLQGGPDFVSAFQRIYFRCLAEELTCLSSNAPGILPGVRNLLDSLCATPAMTSALLTGNYAHSARLKLERFDLWRYFPFGAFGDDEAQREHLVGVALERARAAGVPQVASRDVVVVGDTPLDVACGAANGARTLAVATGSYDVEDLRKAGADLVVPDLSCTDVILSWLSDGDKGAPGSRLKA